MPRIADVMRAFEVQRIEVDFEPLSGDLDITYFFKGQTTVPVSAREFLEDSPTRYALDKLEKALRSVR
jgi:hypothetical protein